LISTQANTYCSEAHKDGPVWNLVFNSMRKQRDEETPDFWDKFQTRVQSLQRTDLVIALGPSSFEPHEPHLLTPTVLLVKNVKFQARRPSRSI